MSALTVIKVNDRKLELDEAQLKKILLHPKAKSKSVMVISIAGALRNGKSTILNFIKRFLERRGIKGWIGSPEEPLIGFDWKQGNEAVTQGILMWSEPFDLSLNGKDVAVLLMDTQGAFEVGSDTAINSAIFTLSTLISSVQIFNTMRMFNQNDFGFLALFSKYATTISAASENKEGFQKLILLIRDWPSPGNIDYGDVELHDYLAKSQNRGHCSQEWKQIEAEFKKAFDHISCYLMPHPGKRMATLQKGKPECDGRIEELDDEFINYLKKFIKNLLKNGVIKKVNRNEVTGEQLLMLFKGYYKTIKSSTVQSPEAILKVVARNDIYAACIEGINYYDNKLQIYSKNKGIWVTSSGVREVSDKACLDVEKKIKDCKLIEDKDLEEEAIKLFKEHMDTTLKNEIKNAETIELIRKGVKYGTIATGVATGGAIAATGAVTGGAIAATSAPTVGTIGTIGTMGTITTARAISNAAFSGTIKNVW